MADAKVVTNTNDQDLSKADLSDKEGHAQNPAEKKKPGVERNKEEDPLKSKEEAPEDKKSDPKSVKKRDPKDKDAKDTSEKPETLKSTKVNQDQKPSDAEFNRAHFRKQHQAEENMSRVVKTPNYLPPLPSQIETANLKRSDSPQMAQHQQALIHSWKERNAAPDRLPNRLQFTETRSIEQKIHDVKQISRISEQVRNLPSNLRESTNNFTAANFSAKDNIVNPSQKSEQSWIPKIAKHIPETVKNLPEAVKSIPIAVKSLPEAVKGILQPLREKLESVRKVDEKREPVLEAKTVVPGIVQNTAPKVEQVETRGTVLRQSELKQPEQKQEIPLHRQIQKDVSKLVLNKIAENAPHVAPKVATLVRESPELKKIIEHIVRQDPNPNRTSREQLQRLVVESFRMSAGNMPTKPTPDQVKKVIADTSTKLASIYGLPVKEPTKPNEPGKPETKAPPKNIERDPSPDQLRKPSVPPPSSSNATPPPPNMGFKPAPIHGFSPNTKEGEIELKEAKDKSEKEKAKEKGRDKDRKAKEAHEAQTEYQKKIREEKKLIVQRTYTISGIVMDKYTHKGIEGVFINGGWLGTAITNASGEFSFHNAPEFKVYTLNFLKRGYQFTPSTVTDTVDGPNKHYIYGTTRR